MKFPVNNTVPVDWTALKEEILSKLDLVSEYRLLGVVFTRGAPSSKGIIECHAFGRPDRIASAMVNVVTGVYHDSGGDGESLNFWDFALRHGEGFGRHVEVVKHYGEKVGITVPTPKYHQGGRIREAVYDYTDEAGNVLFRVFRYRMPNGKKTFSQHPPDGHGGWKFGRGSMDGVELVPYRLKPLHDHMINQGEDSNTVFFVEGEKDADRLASLDFLATCNPMGAGKWREKFSRYFKDIDAIVIPDNDLAGIKHARDVCASLSTVAASVKLLQLPNLPAKGDVSDWLDAGGTPDDLGRLAYAAPAWDAGTAAPEAPADVVDDDDEIDPADVTTVCLADVRPTVVDWLIPDRIPMGKLTLVAGDPGLGKSFTMIDLIARVSTAGPIPCGGGECVRKGSVILLSAEDGLADTIRPRLDACEADVSKVHALTTVRQANGQLGPFDLSYIGYLEHAIRRIKDVVLVVIDPVTAYVGGRIDDHKNTQIRSILGPLSDLAEKYGVAIVIVTHLNKGSGSKALNRITGSLAYAALARAVWLVIKDQDDPARRLFLSVKNNLAPDPSGLAYKIVDSRVEWEESPVLLTANDALRQEQDEKPGGNHQGPIKKSTEAMEWLANLLSHGEVASEEIFDKGNTLGFRKNMLYECKNKLGIKARKVGFGPEQRWYWFPPEIPPDTPGAECQESSEPW